MTDILIIIGFLIVGLLGCWIMGKIDHFISSDSWKPQEEGKLKDKPKEIRADFLSEKNTKQKPPLFSSTL